MTRKEAIELVRKGTHAISTMNCTCKEASDFMQETIDKKVGGVMLYYWIKGADFMSSDIKPALEIINLSDLTEESRKQIGWVLKKDCEKYREAALKIADCSDFYLLGGVEFQQNSIMEDRLKSAGVLELWFEPVYEEETFKEGDWVTVKDEENYNNGIEWTGKLAKFDSDGTVWIEKHSIINSHWTTYDRICVNKTACRKATKIEIEAAKEAQKITLPNSKYEIKVSDGFEIDGNRFSKEFIQACEVISKHSKAAVYVGCDAKGSGCNKWILDQVTIAKIKGKLK